MSAMPKTQTKNGIATMTVVVRSVSVQLDHFRMNNLLSVM